MADPKLPAEVYDRDKPRVVVILGAGFSACAGLPLQHHFLTELLTNEPDDARNRTITAALEEFLQFTFGWRRGDHLPSLEDIFTMIDLSAGSGHALGQRNPPKRLRAIRRLLIHRVFSILDRRFHESDDITQLLKGLLGARTYTSFVVLNWDIVLERHLQSPHVRHAFRYDVDEFPWDGAPAPGVIEAPVTKVHGSANWVYCDNCRQVYFDRESKLSLDINAGLNDDDFQLFDEHWPSGGIGSLTGRTNRDCIRCRAALGPHIATFSYRKSFRSSAFARSWAVAEERLTEADRWLFVGYSLPHADYEFAHLLKTAELKLARMDLRPVRMHVVVKGDAAAEKRYRQMFGSAIELVEQGGLDAYLRTGLRRLLA